MRIVAHNGARIWGGAERATALLLRGLSDRGHDVLLLCNDELVRSGAAATGVAAELCPIGGDVALHHALRLSRVLRKQQPDAFIIGTWKKLFLASLGARMAKVPRVVARVGLETDTARNIKYRIALGRWVDGVAVNSKRIALAFAESGTIDSRRVQLIHNGVRRPIAKAEPGHLRRELRIPQNVFVVGTVARLASQKRIDRLIDAMALTDPSVHCIVAGDGSERSMLAQRIADQGLSERVHMLGARNDTADVLAALDAFVVASDREGLSNAMLEAMAAGLPVISTRVSGAADALEGEELAGIIAGFDAASIAKAINGLQNDRIRRFEMGAAAQGRAETTFAFERMLDRWEAFLAGKSVS